MIHLIFTTLIASASASDTPEFSKEAAGLSLDSSRRLCRSMPDLGTLARHEKATEEARELHEAAGDIILRRVENITALYEKKNQDERRDFLKHLGDHDEDTSEGSVEFVLDGTEENQG